MLGTAKWIVALTLLFSTATNVHAELTFLVSQLDYDESADLEDGRGFGIRWGRSSKIIGGESALMVARPNRQLSDGTQEPMTALFYEGRLLINIPTGTSIRPFFGVGLGMIMLTSIDLKNPTIGSSSETTEDALSRLESKSGALDLQNNRTLSYGGGVRYALGEKLAIRFDVRRYSVFSVKSFLEDEAEKRIREELAGGDGSISADVLDRISADTSSEKTIKHNEISLGLMLSF